MAPRSDDLLHIYERTTERFDRCNEVDEYRDKAQFNTGRADI